MVSEVIVIGVATIVMIRVGQNMIKAMRAVSGESTNSAAAVTAEMRVFQESVDKQLREFRELVGPTLHTTLDNRLGASFKLVDSRLEAVQRGLGEMQTIAGGVGDLKRALTNVKIRGTWAEVQLGSLLEQTLAPSQYQKNVQTRPESKEVVEYVIRLPGDGTEIWLPIDSKFPQEDYLRIQQAADKGDVEGTQKATDALAAVIRKEAQDIQTKYINPPKTTDFAFMFLATEGLYAEVLRYPGLADELQQRRVIVAGPTTLTAMLNSMRFGFQSIAVQHRAAEVWEVLRGFKTELGKFVDLMDTAKKQIATVNTTLEATGTRTRAMERTLKSLETLPDAKVTLQHDDAEVL